MMLPTYMDSPGLQKLPIIVFVEVGNYEAAMTSVRKEPVENPVDALKKECQEAVATAIAPLNDAVQTDWDDCTVFVTKIITRASAEHNELKANEAVENEIAGLIEQQALENFLQDDVPDGSNALGTLVVLAIKHFGTSDALFKTRMVIQRHFDLEAPTIVSDSASVASFANQILLDVSLIYNWDVWSVDAKQAFFQPDWLFRSLLARLRHDMYFKMSQCHNVGDRSRSSKTGNPKWHEDRGNRGLSAVGIGGGNTASLLF
jgi:hypothetical protein